MYEAQVKGTDSTMIWRSSLPNSDMSEETLKSIKVISIGNSDELEIGETGVKPLVMHWDMDVKSVTSKMDQCSGSRGNRFKTARQPEN